MTNNQLLIAYLAGVFDGEGSAGYVSCGVGRGKELVVQVNMTDECIIDLFCDTFGGRKTNKSSIKQGCKPQYIWRLKCASARSALDTMKPYLRLKYI